MPDGRWIDDHWKPETAFNMSRHSTTASPTARRRSRRWRLSSRARDTSAERSTSDRASVSVSIYALLIPRWSPRRLPNRRGNRPMPLLPYTYFAVFRMNEEIGLKPGEAESEKAGLRG